MSSEEYLSEPAASNHHNDSSDGLSVELIRMETSSSALADGSGKGQEASSSGQGSGVDLSAITRGAWKGSDVVQEDID
jgi:hypothetical protein